MFSLFGRLKSEMGVDLTVYVEYQLPDGSWVAVCSKLGDPKHPRPCQKTSNDRDTETCRTVLSSLLSPNPFVTWPDFDRYSPFFALIAPDYVNPWGMNTSWTRDYPVIEMKTSMPETMSSRLEYLRQDHGQDRPWINWVTGKELIDWCNAVRQVDTENRMREYDDSDYEDAQLYVHAATGSMLFQQARAPADDKLSEISQFNSLQAYLTLTQQHAGVSDPERVRLYFHLM